jgi:hypothetical protein
MDRRLPPAPAPFFVQQARRKLRVEQRLDQLAKYRPQTQRYDNPPCWCGDEPPAPTWMLTFGPQDLITPGAPTGDSDSDAWEVDTSMSVLSVRITQDACSVDCAYFVAYGEFFVGGGALVVPAGQTDVTFDGPFAGPSSGGFFLQAYLDSDTSEVVTNVTIVLINDGVREGGDVVVAWV